jgi:hypothetical protein
MAVPTVIIDAANIACRVVRTRRIYHFDRVELVRQTWLESHPDATVHAILDAGVWGRFADMDRLDLANEAGWLHAAAGDADDRILEEASKFQASVISMDGFVFARQQYPWLQGCVDRVFGVSWQGARPRIWPRVLRIATDDEVAEALRRKKEKALRHDADPSARFRCDQSPADCQWGGRVVPEDVLRETADNFVCICGNYLVEVDPDLDLGDEPVSEARGPGFAILRHGVHQATITVPPEGVVIGRCDAGSGYIHDVTAGLAQEERSAISRQHLWIGFDPDGNLVIRHQATNNASFLNPRFGEDGLPVSNRLPDMVTIPVHAGDEIVLGPGAVRLLVEAETW